MDLPPLKGVDQGDKSKAQDPPATAATDVSDKNEQNKEAFEQAPASSGNKHLEPSGQEQTGLNIYSPALAKALALPPLEVEGMNWVKQTELRKHASGAKQNTEELAEIKESEEVKKPQALGSRQIEPDVQQPPKKRGRKPKNPEEPKETRSRSKAPKKGETAKETKEADPASKKRKPRSKAQQSEEPAAEGTPSARLRVYLQGQGKARKAKEAEAPEEAKEAEAPEEKVPKRRRTKGKDHNSNAGPDGDNNNETSSAKRKKVGKTDQEEHADNKEKPAKDKKRKVEDEHDKKPENKKAKYSRKSAAYHRAYKATEGSEEEKKAAARKVPGLH